jgi:PAS domain S-box-containing protein
LNENHYQNIIGLLNGAQKGLTIEEISKNLNLSRITTTKYLNSLLVSGQVNMRKIGPAKSYTLSTRLTFDQIIGQSSDLILVLDETYTVRNVNDSFLRTFGITKDRIENQYINSTFIGPGLVDRIRDSVRQGMAGEESVSNVWIPVQKDWKAFRIRIIPLVFGWGEKGVVIMFEDRTGEIMAQEENALLADLANSSPAAITVSDFYGNFLYSNKKNLDLHGYSLSEFMDRNLEQLEVPNSEKHITERLEDLKKSGEASFEVLHLRKDGRQIPLEVHATIARWGDRDVVISIATDISERKRAEQAIKESERRFAEIIDFLPDATLVVNSEGTVIAWNHAIEKMTGVKARDIVGRGNYAYAVAIHGKRRPVLLDLIFRDDPEVRKTYQYLQKEGSTFTAETFLTPPGAGERFVWMKASPFYDRDGRIIGAVETIRDITGRKMAEEALRQQNLVLETINQLALDFASLNKGKSVPEQAVNSLMKLSGAALTLFNVYDPSDHTLQVTSFEIAPGMLKKLIRLLGKRPGEVKALVSADMYQEMVSNIIGRRKTLTEASFGQIPPLVGMSIQKMMDIDRFIGIAYVIEGKLYGTSLLGMKPGQPDPSAELLEPFAHIVAISLRRDRADHGS